MADHISANPPGDSATSSPEPTAAAHDEHAVLPTDAALGDVADRDEMIEVDPATVPTRVVGIGASAGGLEALEQLVSALPDDTGCAFVVIQHLAPDFRSLMNELLGRRTSMPVHIAENNQQLTANSIYLIPPRHDMIVSSGRLLLAVREKSDGLNLPVDLFFNSLASDQGEDAAAIVLSGTGSDGSRGLVAVHAAGGRVLVQDPKTAAFDGMPNSAIATGHVDDVLAPADIAATLVGQQDESTDQQHEPDFSAGAADGYTTVFELLSSHHQVDFSNYKLGTIARRLDRRQKLLGCQTIEQYTDLLATDPNELAALYSDLLIGVTEFFRDPNSWHAVAHRVLPELIEELPPDKELRCWVAGTATGQEVYTLAILVTEAFKAVGRQPLARIFATDLDRASLDFAGAGIYPATSIAGLDPRYARYFNELSTGDVQIASEVRRLVVFAEHNALSDPPFTNLDFVSCRNLLIYLQPAAQRRVLTLLHFGLRRDGVLMLGSSESLSEVEAEFAAVDRVHRLFTKRRDVRAPLGVRDTGNYEPILGRERLVRPAAATSPQQQLARAYDVLLDDYVPASLLVDGHGVILHSFGKAAELLRSPRGRTSLDAMALVYPELRVPLASGLRRVSRSGDPVTYGGIRITLDNGEERVVRLKVRRLSAAHNDDNVLVIFEDEIPTPEPEGLVDGTFDTSHEGSPISEEHARYLETELRYAQESQQALREELETTNEELQAANEELTASNEELQSSNEELHSVNEELYSVNREYELKISELTSLTQDMDNLLSSTSIGTVFIDSNLRLRKYTETAKTHFNLIPHDIGRPIAHVTRNFEVGDIEARLEHVMQSGLSEEIEISSGDGLWYLLRLHPYRTEADDVAGAVLTFVEIQGVKDMSAQLKARMADLGGFAYGVSHDLQEPVRAITGITSILEARCAQVLDDIDARLRPGAVPTSELVEQLGSAASQLSRMLDLTLTYSRVGTRSAPFEAVDLADVLEAACAEHDRAVREEAAVISAGDLPIVRGDPAQLRWLFGEVIGNSLKFRSERPLRLEVHGAYLDDGTVRVRFVDNGRGMPADDIERAFDMFFRGEGSDDTDGDGGGLAIARRIVEHHGGSVQLSSSSDGGVVVDITLLAAQPAHLRQNEMSQATDSPHDPVRSETSRNTSPAGNATSAP